MQCVYWASLDLYEIYEIYLDFIVSDTLGNSLDRYSDPMSAHYVPDKQMLMFIYALIGVVMAIPFMHLFDSICDVRLHYAVMFIEEFGRDRHKTACFLHVM